MIIGICGFQSAGKDTLGDYLVREHQFVKLSFASLLKDIISILFSWDREKLEGLTTENREWREKVDEWWANKLNMPKLTPRYVMQFFGTDLFRNHWHKDVWVTALEKKVINYLSENKNIVITDCRFPNEIDFIKKYNGILIHVHKILPEWFYSFSNNSNNSYLLHPSELEWIKTKFDYTIPNNSTKEDLYNLFISLNILN